MKAELFECEDDLLTHVDRAVLGDAVLALAQVDGAVDVGAAEGLLGPETIVRTTTNAEVFGLRPSAEGVGDDVIQFQERRRLATMAFG
jgi:hypothetical protein